MEFQLGKVNTQNEPLILRAKPFVSSDESPKVDKEKLIKVFYILKGGDYKVDGKNRNDWYRIKMFAPDNKNGYVAAAFVKIVSYEIKIDLSSSQPSLNLLLDGKQKNKLTLESNQDKSSFKAILNQNFYVDYNENFKFFLDQDIEFKIIK